MKKDIIQKAIIIPAAISAVLIALFLLVAGKFVYNIFPVNNNTVLAYHDKTEKEEDNALAGSIGDLPLRYNAGYSALLTDASVVPGSADFGENGCTYVKILNSNASYFGKTVTASGNFGEHTYKLSYDFEADSEEEVLTAAPKSAKSVIVYYRVSDGTGITSKYRAMVYEEVA